MRSFEQQTNIIRPGGGRGCGFPISGELHESGTLVLRQLVVDPA